MRTPPDKLNVKNETPLLSFILVYSIVLVFSRMLFSAFFGSGSECFLVISGFSIAIYTSGFTIIF